MLQMNGAPDMLLFTPCGSIHGAVYTPSPTLLLIEGSAGHSHPVAKVRRNGKDQNYNPPDNIFAGQG